jgi:hypothetical protein
MIGSLMRCVSVMGLPAADCVRADVFGLSRA